MRDLPQIFKYQGQLDFHPLCCAPAPAWSGTNSDSLSMKICPPLILTAVLSAAAALPARADLVVYEGFNGYAEGPLPGQTVSAQSTGLDPVTTVTSAGAGALSNIFQPASLTFSNLIVTGGSALYDDTGGRASYIGFAYNGPTVTGTLYSSYLANLISAQNSASVVSLRVNTSSTTGGANSWFHTYSDVNGSAFTGSQYDAANASTASNVRLENNTVYVVIGRFTNVGTALTAVNPGVATTFVMTQAQFDFFKPGGFTDAELDAAPVGPGEGEVTSRVSDAPVASGTFTLTAGRGIQFGPGNALTTGSNQTIAYDEIRFGASLTDVLPLTGVVPDPDAAITLTVPDNNAQEPTAAGAASGKFTITRAGATTSPLRIFLTTNGTATNGVDFPTLPESVLIPAGAASMDIPITAYTDSLTEGSETLTLTLTAGAGYILPAVPTGTITLTDRPAGVPATRSRFVQKLAAGLSQRMLVYGTSLTANGAWPAQVLAGLNTTWPGLTTLINRGGSGETSVWGVANLDSQVIAAAPDVVFIEFSVNDAVARFGISLAQARANLDTILNGIRTALPNCEIILQVTNPVIGRPQGDDGWRPNLEHYQQIYRDAAERDNLLLIDHHPAWQALLDSGEAEFLTLVPDGLHPVAAGEESYMTPVILQRIGAPPLPSPSIIVDNADLGALINGNWTISAASLGGYAGGYLHDGNIDKGVNSVSFQPDIPSAGLYPVYLRWTSNANRATNVPVTVTHAGVTTTLTINQTVNGGIWFKLGDFNLTAGTGNSVLVETTGTNGFVIADAVGIGRPGVMLHASHGRPAEPSTSGGAARTSLLTVSRNGPVQQAMTVGLTYGGTAINGTDYDLLPASITIPAGSASAILTLKPKHDSGFEGPETFTVSLTPQENVSVSLPGSASLFIVEPGDSPFTAWQLTQFSQEELTNSAWSGPAGDPDGDGLANLLEFYTGLLPETRDAANAITAGTTETGGDNFMTLTYRRAPGTSLGGVPESSPDLLNWNPDPALFELTTDAPPAELQRITARYLTPLTNAPSRSFLRLKVVP